MDLQSFSTTLTRMVWLFMPVLILIQVASDEATGDRDSSLAFKKAITHDYRGCISSWVIRDGDSTACWWDNIVCNTDHRVTEINLPKCNMLGSLVPDLGNLTMLTVMIIYSSALQGAIPREFGKLVNLQNLALYDNMLEGTIPRELGFLKNLAWLELQSNNLEGIILDNLIQNFKNMPLVDLTDNFHLKGTTHCFIRRCCPCCNPDTCEP